MREITTTEEMLACNEAIREVDHLLLDPDEETEHALRQMWTAGRDWAQGVFPAAPQPRRDEIALNNTIWSPTKNPSFHGFEQRINSQNIRTLTPFGFFQEGWDAAFDHILNHEREHGHQWAQALGESPGICDDCN